MSFIDQLDCRLFIFINSYAGDWLWLDILARLFLNDYFVPTVMAILLLILWFEEMGAPERIVNQRAVLVGSVSAALANTLLKIVNLFYYRPRPFDKIDVHLLFYRPTDSSLPSNAAVLGFAIATGVWFYRRSWGWTLLGLAAVFGLSRVYGGVHFPLDVITGAGLGCLSAWFIHGRKNLITLLLTMITNLSAKLNL